MGRPKKPPAILVEATVRRSGKLAALPSDAARLGFFYVVLAEAKLADPPGQFASREQFREVAGRFARYLDDYTGVGILETAPKLCSRCAPKWTTMPPKRGALVVHDWHDHQYDPRRLERQAAYDDRQREASNDAISDGVSDAQSDAISDEKPPSNGGVSDAISAEFLTPVSGARESGARRDRAANGERRTTNGISSGENPGARDNGKVERADIAALLERWPKVTKPQRKVLDEVLERHDVTGPAFAAQVIRATPADKDPLAAVLDADRLWQDAQRRRAEAEESAWSEAKADGTRGESQPTRVGEIDWLTEPTEAKR